jgi:hypothetical protein
MGSGVIGRTRSDQLRAPAGRLNIARRFSAGTKSETKAVPVGWLNLSPDISRVVLDSVPLKKRQELFFKPALVMVLGLGTNIGNCACLLRDSH